MGRGGVEDPDVVLGAVRSGVAGPEQDGEDLPGAFAGTVITGGDERGEEVAVLVGSGDAFLDALLSQAAVRWCHSG